MKPELRDFYDRWQAKANQYDDVDDLSHYYDKFFSLFVVFNRLYAEATKHLIASGNIKNQYYNDRSMATGNLYTFFRKSGIPSLTSQLNQDSLDRLKAALPLYNIDLARDGKARKDNDKKLLEDLDSRRISKKTKSLLKIIYFVRCNMFHGQKGYEIYQKPLLTPLNLLLNEINEMLFNKLSE